jgi:hypothetical protein
VPCVLFFFWFDIVLTVFALLIAIGVLMNEKKIDGLTKMYGLFARNNGLKILCAHFKAHIQVGYSSH